MKSLQEHLNESLENKKPFDVKLKMTDLSKLKVGDYVSDGLDMAHEISKIISLNPLKIEIVKSKSDNPVGKIIEVPFMKGHKKELVKVLNPEKAGI